MARGELQRHCRDLPPPSARCVQHRREGVYGFLQTLDLISFQELSAESSTKEVLCLFERSPCDPHETTVVAVAPTPLAFGDVGPNAISCSDELLTHCSLCEGGPGDNDAPELVCQALSKLIDMQVLKIASAHTISPSSGAMVPST